MKEVLIAPRTGGVSSHLIPRHPSLPASGPRKRREKTRRARARAFVSSSQSRAPVAHLPQPFPIFRFSDWRRTLEQRVPIRNLLRGEGGVVRARLRRDSPPRSSCLGDRLEAVSVRHVRHVDTPTGARRELRQHNSRVGPRAAEAIHRRHPIPVMFGDRKFTQDHDNGYHRGR